jgi:hypothetical protein
MSSISRLGPDIQSETVLVLLIPKTSSKLTEDRQTIAGEIGKFGLWWYVRWAIAAEVSVCCHVICQRP